MSDPQRTPIILYVEDDPRSRKVMEVILVKQMGITELSIFEDSTDFLFRVEALDPAPTLILLDIHVTPFDGFQMLELLRQTERWTTTPVVALTASVMNEEVQRLREAGFDSCIAKPVNMKTFPDYVQRILHGEQIWNIVS